MDDLLEDRESWTRDRQWAVEEDIRFLVAVVESGRRRLFKERLPLVGKTWLLLRMKKLSCWVISLSVTDLQPLTKSFNEIKTTSKKNYLTKIKCINPHYENTVFEVGESNVSMLNSALLSYIFSCCVWQVKWQFGFETVLRLDWIHFYIYGYICVTLNSLYFEPCELCILTFVWVITSTTCHSVTSLPCHVFLRFHDMTTMNVDNEFLVDLEIDFFFFASAINIQQYSDLYCT